MQLQIQSSMLVLSVKLYVYIKNSLIGLNISLTKGGKDVIQINTKKQSWTEDSSLVLSHHGKRMFFKTDITSVRVKRALTLC